MYQLDENFLQSVGLGSMPADQQQAFLQHLYEELELRVGTRLSEGMTNEQLDEFERLIDANDQQGALGWLETHRPNYKQVVSEELEKLKQEVMANKDRILSEVQQPVQQIPQPQDQGFAAQNQPWDQGQQSQPPIQPVQPTQDQGPQSPVWPQNPQQPTGQNQGGQDPTELQIR